VQIEQIIQGEIHKKHTKNDLTIFLGKELIMKMIKARGLRIGTTLDPYLKKKIEQKITILKIPDHPPKLSLK
jgi:hypothetical protein